MTAKTFCKLIFLFFVSTAAATNNAADFQIARGTVFSDTNSSGIFDEGDQPLAKVAVSNGRDVVLTDSQGRYELNIRGDAEIFVIKPRNYHSPVNKHNLPQFYYLHRPQGSPSMQYAGISPTGPLPESIDFPLLHKKESDDFNVIIFGDPQARDMRETLFVMKDAVEELVDNQVSKTAAFGITLGDLAFNNLDMYEPLNSAISAAGLPWFNVIGNHDCNHDAASPEKSYETFQSVFGPSYYAFNYGQAHFIVLNTIYKRHSQDGYTPGISSDQLSFIAGDLKYVPKNNLIVLLMHIPLFSDFDKSQLQVLFELLKDRPNTLSFSAHTHQQIHKFFDESNGWMGAKPHHEINVGAVCGGWWTGLPDEYGTPVSMMGDGTPNGYGILSVKGNTYIERYKVLGKPADFQMHIDVPQVIAADLNEPITVSANVFNAWPDSQIKMRISRGRWITMGQTVSHDPTFLAYRKLDQCDPNRWWPAAKICTHLWSAQIPNKLHKGTHVIEVEALNPDGQVFRGVRVVRVK